MTQLSPAAQAIWVAYCNAIGHTSIYVPHDAALGAALRAAVDQVLPAEKRPDPSQGFTHLCLWEQRVFTRLQFLGIAHELEGRE